MGSDVAPPLTFITLFVIIITSASSLSLVVLVLAIAVITVTFVVIVIITVIIHIVMTIFIVTTIIITMVVRIIPSMVPSSILVSIPGVYIPTTSFDSLGCSKKSSQLLSHCFPYLSCYNSDHSLQCHPSYQELKLLSLAGY